MIFNEIEIKIAVIIVSSDSERDTVVSHKGLEASIKKDGIRDRYE